MRGGGQEEIRDEGKQRERELDKKASEIDWLNNLPKATQLQGALRSKPTELPSGVCAVSHYEVSSLHVPPAPVPACVNPRAL